jgi:diaminobutyrate-2-oxoglutarate transaminase
MRIIEREQLAAHAEAMGHLLTAGLKEIAERFPQLGEVRGRGLMIGVEVTRPDTSGSSASAGAAGMADPTLARSIKLHCFERGLIIETGGRNGSVLRFLPPLIITREDVATILDRFEQAVRAGTRG